MKKIICLLLAAVMAFSFTGCRYIDKLASSDSKPTPSASAAATEPAPTSPSATDPAAPDPTDEPEVTTEPIQVPEADVLFRELDLEIFQTLVTSGTAEYNQYIASENGAYGITRADVTPGWGSLTYEEHVRSMDYYRETLTRLSEIDREELSDMNKLGYDAIRNAFQMQLMFEDYYYFDEPLEPMNGYHTMLPLSLICFNLRYAPDVEDYMLLLEDLPRFIGEIEAFEEEKAERGLFMTETALDQVLESCRDFAAKGEDCFIISYFEDEVVPRAKELGYSDEECEALSERAREAVVNGILPAYTSLADALEAHRDDCSELVGAAGRSPEALEYYKLKVMDEGATMDNIETIRSKISTMGFSVLGELTRVIYSADDDLLERFGEPISVGSVQDNVAWLEEFIKDYYPELPPYNLRYTEVPDDIAEDFSPAAYLTPAFDNYTDNLMLINPTEETASEILTIGHETVPGHLFQFVYTRNITGMSLAQQVLEPTGYAEAWTEFTEYFISKNAGELDPEYCMMMNLNSTFGNVFLPAYVSILVNVDGMDEDGVAEALDMYGMAEYADIFYEYAVTMPYYAMPYAIGYAYLREIYQSENPIGNDAHKAFFEKYLSFGPNYLDVIQDLMKK